MILTGSVYITKVVYNINFDALAKVDNFWTSVLVDIYILPKTIRI